MDMIELVLAGITPSAMVHLITISVFSQKQVAPKQNDSK